MEWFQTYTRIAFELHAALEAAGDMYFVDTFYGPDEWRVESPPADLRETLRDIERLHDILPAIISSADRVAFLQVNLRALETVCRYLLGEPMTLREAAQGMLDIEPLPIPEARMEEYRQKIEYALGGSGTLAERFARFHAQVLIQTADNDHLLTLFENALVEARRRTRAILPLPDDQGVDASIITGVLYGAANWYKGNYRSAMELNGDRPSDILRLLILACHEGYPGHHTESVLKEKSLYRDRGYTEQCLVFNGPQVVISEGIATLAASMIFPPQEAANWMQDQYEALGRRIQGVDLPLLLEALWGMDPDAMGTNLLLRMEDGARPEDSIAYAGRYALTTEVEVRRSVSDFYNASLLRRVYLFSYYHGRHLMEPLLQGNDRMEVWHRLLTEQLTPGMLRSWNSRHNARE